MRMLIKAAMPVETANAAMANGTFGDTVRSILAELKPEAAYFYEENGGRTALMIADLADPSGIPAIAEPWFLAFNAKVEFHPAMTAEDLGKAMPDIERALGKYGARASAKRA